MTQMEFNPSLRRAKGFTLIELVMVILLLAVLGAVAIPNFIDFRSDAKNSTVKGGVGAMRAALSIAQSAIQLREASTAPQWPTLAEMQGNAFVAASHPVLAGTNIMNPSQGIPQNPWSTAGSANFATIIDCSGVTYPNISSSAGGQGWCYNATTGQIWANSKNNGLTTTENNY